MTAPFSAHLPHAPLIHFVELSLLPRAPLVDFIKFSPLSRAPLVDVIEHHSHARPSSISSNFHRSHARPLSVAQNLILAACRNSIKFFFKNNQNFILLRPSYPPPHDGAFRATIATTMHFPFLPRELLV